MYKKKKKKKKTLLLGKIYSFLIFLSFLNKKPQEKKKKTIV
jgi:hypothetical protein